jgi:hypothetical protein
MQMWPSWRARKQRKWEIFSARVSDNTFFQERPGDWPEDFAEENGNYLNTCSGCGELFSGNKHRCSCAVCALAHTKKLAAMTPEERKAHDAELLKFAVELANKMTT